MAENPEAASPPPHVQLKHMISGLWASRLIYAAAKLELADRLADGPKDARELAALTGTHAPSLHRFLRSLTGLGIFTQRADGKFGLTPLGEALRSDAPGSARAVALLSAGDMNWRSWEHVLYALRTGDTGCRKAYGVPLFEYLTEHPEESANFAEAMVGFNSGEPPAVAAGYDFSAFEVIVDVGGSTGNLLAHILERHERARGVLFDLPDVVADAFELIRSEGLEDRIDVEAGDFFEKVPTGGDAYILSHIIHDWDELQCIRILRNCRDAMGPESRLLIVESVLPEGDAPHVGKLVDMVMLVVTGGQERTANEYASLLHQAGFRLNRVVPTESNASIVEAVLA